MRGSDDPKVKPKVMDLWRVIANRLDYSSIEDKRLASKLCQWMTFIDQIDDSNRELILRVAPYADVAHNTYELLRGIANISGRQPFDAAEVWTRLLEGATPDYPDKAIRTTLSNLVGAGPEGVRKAREIVSAYLKVANEKPARLLRELEN
jgi:hypothetical protein